MNPRISVVVLAAGEGTRMKSKRAKVLHRAGGLPLVEHVLNTASELTGEENIVVVVGHRAEDVKAALAHRQVHFALQKEQRGTGDAVKACRDLLDHGGLLVVLYGDCPLLAAATLRRLIERQVASDAAATLITTRLSDPTGYGRIILDDRGNVKAIVEQKAASSEQLAIDLINPGMYCFRSDLLWKHIDSIGTNNPAREYYLTDMVEILTRAGHTVAAMESADASELLGINTRVELAEVDRIFRARKCRELMLAGVTIEKPESVTIDLPVTIGRDTIVGPFAHVLGRTEIGEDCRIGAGCVIESSRIESGVQVAPYTLIATSHVGRDARLGPFSRLRLENEVGAGAHVGNFVELKKTNLGPGAKANHLAYLGDSDIGAKTNVGAGTITCNYDGVKKHRTHIGDNAFVGSNSTLVAPVQVGDDSYIGAGSVITGPVPDGALAIGRGHQVNKEGWVAKRRAKKS
jgi:bifunctional UDP-N-acetylglucosamine pyrophosphorylase / glucosamine-1-phosphate N-acetyltransferase